jgi:hypothetical protein
LCARRVLLVKVLVLQGITRLISTRQHRLTIGCDMPRTDCANGCQLAKCAWFTCVATRKALAAIVKLGFIPALEGKNEPSTT